MSDTFMAGLLIGSVLGELIAIAAYFLGCWMGARRG